MTPRWPATTHLKIHEHCGGMVRWVEAYDRPGVGFTGECLECGREGIVVESIIPIRCDSDETAVDLYNEVPIETLRDLEWDDDDEWNHNQKRLQQKVRE